ncbi:Tat pathway signal protein [Oceaniferula spumae]|uniref:Tat pathway signal protein n=1 Tax=Oceaniferula spumae TaxID=2979115 RepID=A0AAT9FLB9_9BACT
MKDQQPPSRFLGRRRFLGEIGCAALSTAPILSSILNLRLIGELAAAEAPADDDYRALVCVFLAGGNDSFNMLAPVDVDGYAEYAAARTSVALAVSDFSPLTGNLPDGRTLGLQDSMPNLKALFEANKAAFVCNVGTLVEPTDITSYTNGSAALPSGLFSHSDQQMHWHSSMPDNRSPTTGWAGRMADLLEELNGESQVSMNISLDGINLFQSGAQTVPLSLNSNGVAPELTSWNSASYLPKRTAIESILDAQYQNAFQRTFAAMKKNAIRANASYKSAIALGDAVTTSFTTTNNLSVKLQTVAKTIAARTPLQKKRQTFFVVVPGWDLHGSLEANHPALLASVDQALGEFQNAMASLGIEDQVTLYSASDFARTLSSNGSGTDHAWGGNQFVVGGAVNGGKFYGDYPELALGSSLDTGRGRLIPTTSVDQYFAEMACWMGVSQASLPMVLPNLSRFSSEGLGYLTPTL